MYSNELQNKTGSSKKRGTLDIKSRDKEEPLSNQLSISRQNVKQSAGDSDALHEKLMSRFKGVSDLPRTLRKNAEAMSGFDLRGVKVHRDSTAPEQFEAGAYAQGKDIYIAHGEEDSLPHELGHIIQNMRGQVRPDSRENGMNLNRSAALEREADLMGSQMSNSSFPAMDSPLIYAQASDCIQCAPPRRKKGKGSASASTGSTPQPVQQPQTQTALPSGSDSSDFKKLLTDRFHKNAGAMIDEIGNCQVIGLKEALSAVSAKVICFAIGDGICAVGTSGTNSPNPTIHHEIPQTPTGELTNPFEFYNSLFSIPADSSQSDETPSAQSEEHRKHSQMVQQIRSEAKKPTKKPVHGSVQEDYSFCSHSVINCAEEWALNNYIEHGGKISEVRLSAFDNQTGKVKPPCENCQRLNELIKAEKSRQTPVLPKVTEQSDETAIPPDQVPEMLPETPPLPQMPEMPHGAPVLPKVTEQPDETTIPSGQVPETLPEVLPLPQMPVTPHGAPVLPAVTAPPDGTTAPSDQVPKRGKKKKKQKKINSKFYYRNPNI